MAANPDSVIRTWFDEVWNQGKEETIDRLLARDARAHGLAADGAPVVGPAGFKPFFRSFRGAFPDLRVEVLRTVTEGDVTACHCRVTGSHRGDDLGVAATGRPIDFSGVAIVRVRDGQIAEGWNHFDFLSLYQQVGLVPKLEERRG